MRADPPPDHVPLAWPDLRPVLEGRASIRRPGQLPYAPFALYALEAEAVRHRTGSKALDQLRRAARNARCCGALSRLKSRQKPGATS